MIIDALKKAVARLYPQKSSVKQIEQELMRKEAAIGATLFGPIPEGHLRQFVCLDEKTVLWYESRAAGGQPITTRYEVYADHIVKVQDDQPAQIIPEVEAKTLLQAVRWYHYLVAKNVYGVAL